LDTVQFETRSSGLVAVFKNEPSPGELIALRDRNVVDVVINDGTGWRGRSVAFLSELPWLRSLMLCSIVVPVRDDAAVSELHGLVRLDLLTYATNEIDFRNTPLLENLTYIWRKRTKHLSTLAHLRKLEITGYGHSDIDDIALLDQLEQLDVLGGRITNLSHIGSLSKLRRLRLGALPHLRSITGIEELQRLESLTIDSCNAISSIEPLAKCLNLRTLELSNIGPIPSLSPLRALKHLEEVNFAESTSVEDGQIAFLREMGISPVRFQNRRHYDMKRDGFSQQ
jgi:hypothetical protein